VTRADAAVTRWPLAVPGRADLATVDRLARLALMAGRAGCAIAIRGACADLVALLDLVGLGAVVRTGPPSA
jgi:ABC-type transporter Mla MlaB component